MTTRSRKSVDWIAAFSNILELEEANGFNDKAVIGGLDGYVRHWAGEMTALLGETTSRSELARPGYSRMTLAERADWVAQWRPLLDGSPLTTPANQEPPEPDKPAKAKAKPATGKSRSQAGPATAPAAQKKDLDAPVTVLRRVNDKLAGQLAKLEVETIRDLLYHFPRRHDDYSNKVTIAAMTYGQDCTVEGKLLEVRLVLHGQPRIEAVLADETGNVRITWFGQRNAARYLKAGAKLAVSGRVDVFNGRLALESPEYETLSPGRAQVHTGRLLPVYPLTAGLTAKNLRSLTWQVLQDWLPQVAETLPASLRSRAGLVPLQTAIRQAHYPDSWEQWAEARRRLAFDELLTLQLSVLSRRQQADRLVQGVAIETGSDLVENLVQSLPFSLTSAQQACIEEILADLRQGTPPMNRLLQGEVGSGKTVVALVALPTWLAWRDRHAPPRPAE